MRFHSSVAPAAAALALLLVLCTGNIASAQGSGADLSGTWTEASGGQATFARRADGGYDVTWKAQNGGVTLGKATFEGGKLAVQLDSRDGMTSGVQRAFAGATTTGTTGQSAYDYKSAAGDPYERLGLTLDEGAAIAGGGELRRQKPGVLSQPLPETAYGTPSQAAATRATVADAEGNRDGIVGNESQASGSTGVLSWLSLQPFVDKVRLWLDARKSDKPALDAFVASSEKAWGKPVTQLAPDALPDMGRFRAEKAALLTRFGRTPDDVTEEFVQARGTVDGNTIAPRDVFTQRWKPIGKPNGKVVVVSPGFQETGREFVEQANALDKLGYDVILMDNQWSGYTTGGEAGGIDRGFGIARDVASVAAQGAQVAARDYAQVPGHGVILVGNSMGAGPGVLGALTLNDAGLLHLDGAAMPRGLDAVLEAPFIQMTPSWLNKTVEFMARVPGVRSIEMPAAGLPILSHDDAANAKFSNHAASEDVRAQLGSMVAAAPDITRIRALVDAGKGPAGKIYVIHADKDPLADPAGSQWLVGKLGGRGKLDLIHADDHVLEEAPSEQNHLEDGMKWVNPSGATGR